MDASLYQPEAEILARLEDRLKAPLNLREVYAHEDLSGVQAQAVATPSIALIAAPTQIREADLESVVIETRWLVVACARAVNDARATGARDEAGRIALAAVANLIGWIPTTGFTPLVLRQAQARQYTNSRVFVPLLFGTSTTIDAIN